MRQYRTNGVSRVQTGDWVRLCAASTMEFSRHAADRCIERSCRGLAAQAFARTASVYKEQRAYYGRGGATVDAYVASVPFGATDRVDAWFVYKPTRGRLVCRAGCAHT